MLTGADFAVGGIATADKVLYDNSTSHLSATNVKTAIDEVNGKINHAGGIVIHYNQAEVSMPGLSWLTPVSFSLPSAGTYLITVWGHSLSFVPNDLSDSGHVYLGIGVENMTNQMNITVASHSPAVPYNHHVGYSYTRVVTINAPTTAKIWCYTEWAHGGKIGTGNIMSVATKISDKYDYSLQ